MNPFSKFSILGLTYHVTKISYSFPQPTKLEELMLLKQVHKLSIEFPHLHIKPTTLFMFLH